MTSPPFTALNRTSKPFFLLASCGRKRIIGPVAWFTVHCLLASVLSRIFSWSG